MPEMVNIPISRFEYRADYAIPNIGLLIDRREVVQALFETLLKWGLEADGVEAISKGKTSEQGVQFVLHDKKTTLFFGASHCTFAKDDSDWNAAPEIIEMLSAFTGALKGHGEIEFGTQKTTVSMHIQPTTVRFLDLLKPFLSSSLQTLSGAKLLTGASLIKWDGGRVTLDGSGRLANAIFVLFEQQFDSKLSFEEIGRAIWAMESDIFRLLDIEEAK